MLGVQEGHWILRDGGRATAHTQCSNAAVEMKCLENLAPIAITPSSLSFDGMVAHSTICIVLISKQPWSLRHKRWVLRYAPPLLLLSVILLLCHQLSKSETTQNPMSSILFSSFLSLSFSF